MPQFSYVARDGAGRLQRGAVEATSAVGVRTMLQARGMRLVSVQQEETREPILEQLATYLNPFHWLPPRSVDIEVSLEQLAVMLRSGLSLLEALRTLARQARFRPLRRIWEEVGESIQEGDSLAEAMDAQKRFPTLAIQLVRVGEATGNLDLVLERAAVQIRQRRQNVTNLLTALAYPLFVALAAVSVAAYLVAVVIPQLQKFLTALGRKLPPITQSLVDVSSWIQANGLTAAAMIVGAVMAVVLIYVWPPGRMTMDRLALRLPVIGYVLRLAGTVTFSSALAVMLRSGITVLDALRTVERLHSNRYLASRVAAARESVIQGDALSRPLAVRHAYLPMLASMVAVGENTGQLDEVLEQVARFHEQQLEAAIKRLSALIEPAIILVVGGIVGYVYLAFFVALFSAGGAS